MGIKMDSKSMVEECLARIEIWRTHIENLSLIVNDLHHNGCRDKLDAGELLDRLHEKELHQWRDLFMWALTVDDDMQERIKAMAHQRFLNKNQHVTNYFTHGVHEPRSWLCSDEKEFREMAREVFAPKLEAPDATS